MYYNKSGEPLLFCADLAQLVEHFTRNEGVTGSIPALGIDKKPCIVDIQGFLLFYHILLIIFLLALMYLYAH